VLFFNVIKSLFWIDGAPQPAKFRRLLRDADSPIQFLGDYEVQEMMACRDRALWDSIARLRSDNYEALEYWRRVMKLLFGRSL